MFTTSAETVTAVRPRTANIPSQLRSSARPGRYATPRVRTPTSRPPEHLARADAEGGHPPGLAHPALPGRVGDLAGPVERDPVRERRAGELDAPHLPEQRRVEHRDGCVPAVGHHQHPSVRRGRDLRRSLPDRDRPSRVAGPGVGPHFAGSGHRDVEAGAVGAPRPHSWARSAASRRFRGSGPAGNRVSVLAEPTSIRAISSESEQVTATRVPEGSTAAWWGAGHTTGTAATVRSWTSTTARGSPPRARPSSSPE